MAKKKDKPQTGFRAPLVLPLSVEAKESLRVKQEQLRRAVQDDVEAFLANGGKVQRVATGATAYEFVNDYRLKARTTNEETTV